MSTQIKPYGSLSNQNVLDIVNDIESKIATVQKDMTSCSDDSPLYSMLIVKQTAYYECLNLILSKI